MASSPAQLQALIDALACYCAALHMALSVPKTQVMVVSNVPTEPVVFTCNGNPVEQVPSFKYCGLHFHRSDAIHVIQPTRAEAGGSWATVQRRHSLLQCGKAINLHLYWLYAVLVPVMQYGCEIWGMHSPCIAAANNARLALQCLHDDCLRILCDLSPSTPCRRMLADSGLLPLQVIWWRCALQFWNSLAVPPAGSLNHSVCLDSLLMPSKGVLAI